MPSKYDHDSSDDESVDSYNTSDDPEGKDFSPPCDAPAIVSAPPRRSRRLRGERAGPEMIRLASHPDYARCNTSMVTDRMRDKGFIQANKAQFGCTPGAKQPPRSARLGRKNGGR